jgi:hypothetical protein
VAEIDVAARAVQAAFCGYDELAVHADMRGLLTKDFGDGLFECKFTRLSVVVDARMVERWCSGPDRARDGVCRRSKWSNFTCL